MFRRYSRCLVRLVERLNFRLVRRTALAWRDRVHGYFIVAPQPAILLGPVHRENDGTRLIGFHRKVDKAAYTP